MDIMKCQICSLELSKQLIFSCNDKICAICVLKQLFFYNLHDFETLDHITINCYCNKGLLSLSLDEITELTKYLFLESQIENICQKHNCPASYYCENCSKFICNSCIKTHKDTKVYHTITKCQKHLSSSSQNVKKIDEDFITKIPFKYNTYEQYVKHADEVFILFENKVKEYQKVVIDNINETISLLESYKLSFIESMKNKLNRETKVVNIFKSLYRKFFEELNVLINKNDFKTFNTFCSINRIFSSIEIEPIDQMTETIEMMKEDVRSSLEKMKPISFKYCFPVAFREYKNTSTLIGHTDIINCVVLLKDGSIASGGRDIMIRIWTKEITYQNTLNLTGHKGWISNLLLLLNGHLLSGSYDGTLKIWDSTNNYTNTHTLIGHTNWVSSSLQFTTGTLISSSYDNSIIVWSSKNFSKLEILKEHTFGVFSMCILPNNHFASGGGDKCIKIWNSEITIVRTLKGQNATINCLTVMTKPNYLASCGSDGNLKIWNHSTGECLITIKAHNDEVSCLISLNDGRLVTGSGDNLIKIWDNENKFNCTHILKGHSSVVTCLITTSEGHILSASADKIMKIWSTERKMYYESS